MPVFSVLIPAYNEKAALREIFARTKAVPVDKEIIVADDGSTDGSRFKDKPNRFLTFLSELTTDPNLPDVQTCYKEFRGEVIQSIPLSQDRFGFDPEVTAKIAKRRYRIFEVAVRYNGRTCSEGKKIGLRDVFNALWCIARYAFFH